MKDLKSGLVHLHWSALCTELGTFRSDVDELRAEFRDRYGPTHEVVQRTEALSAAIQRLERAISRHQLRTMSASLQG